MLKYKGYKICQNYKTIWRKNKRSGHEWRETIPTKGFYIMGKGISSKDKFSTIDKAQDYIDYIIRTKQNITYYHITRKTHSQHYKRVV